MERNSMVNIRGLSIIGVILIHITANYLVRGELYSNDFLNVLLNTVSRFSVPIFFISSGFGTSLNHRKYKTAGQYYKSRLKLIPDFLFWGLIFAVISGYSFSIKNVLKIILGMSFYHLYFIPALLICYLLYPAVVKYFYSNTKILFLILLGLLLQTIYFLGFPLPYFQLYGFPLYFLLGIYFQKNPMYLERLKSKSLLIFCSGTIIMVGMIVVEYLFSSKPLGLVVTSLKPTVFLYAVGILLLFVKYFSESNDILSILDKNSLNIYYVHPIYLILISKVFSSLNLDIGNGLLEIVIKLFAVTILSLSTSLVINYIKKRFKETFLIN